MGHELRYVAVSPFVHSTEDIMREYLSYGTRHTYKKNEVIILSGADVVNGILYLDEGMVRSSSLNYDGSERTLFIVLDHTVFNEVPFFTRNLANQTNVTFRAVEASVVYHFPTEVIESLMAQDPRLASSLLETMGRKTKALVHQLGDSVISDPMYRLVKCLYVLYVNEGIHEEERYIIPYSFTHQTLANYVGLHRVTVSKLLKELTEQGVISKEKDRIVILDMKYFLTMLHLVV